MNKALHEWAKEDIRPHQKRGNGRITALAKHLGVSQPAVTKMIDGSSNIKFKYIKQIMEFTGISAKDIFPEHYELLKESIQMEMENAVNQKKKDLLVILSKVSNDIKRITV